MPLVAHPAPLAPDLPSAAMLLRIAHLSSRLAFGVPDETHGPSVSLAWRGDSGGPALPVF
jgi:hypothetical protein